MDQKNGKVTHVVPVAIIHSFAKSLEKGIVDESKDNTGKFYDFAQYAKLFSSLYGFSPVEHF